MDEFDTILDDWHLLKRAPLRSRKQVGNLVRKTYSPKHSSKDEKSPLWWRQEALRNKWSGIVLDEMPLDGSAMLGLSSITGIIYTTYIPNLRHRDRLELAARVFGLPVKFCQSMEEFTSLKGTQIR